MNKQDLILSLREKGISENIVNAMNQIAREDFVPPEYKINAYNNIALPLAENATISQPSTLAFMLELLEVNLESNILEIGSGSGYALAVLAELAPQGNICGVEIHEGLVKSSRALLKKYDNVCVHFTSGQRGFLKHAPYDRILVSAAFSQTPHHLIEQLNVGGILVAPVRNKIVQIKKYADGIKEKEFEGFAFVGMQ